MALDTTIPNAFKRHAEAALSGRIAKMVLFGSPARGGARGGSHRGGAGFPTGKPDYSARRALSDASFEVIMETGAVVQPVAFAIEQEFEDMRIFRRIRDEGIVL